MVEFAIILPLFLIILTGVTELGRALYQQNSLYKSVSTGARYMARSKDVLNTDDCSKNTALWDAAHVTAMEVVVYGEKDHDLTAQPVLPHLNSSDETIAKITIEPRQENDFPKTDLDGAAVTEDICVITVTAEVNFAGLFGDIVIPFSSVGTFKIRAESEERYIGQ